MEVLKKIESESVDVIYLDPPFFSNRNYEVIWGDDGEIRSFQDRWSGGIDHYIAWLKERIQELYRVLKSTGSIFLHCDWHANAYIRVYVLDKIFGEKNFRNEIIWQRTQSMKAQSSFFSKTKDSILAYSKTDHFLYYQQIKPYSQTNIPKHYNKIEPNTGRIFTLDNFTQQGQGEARDFRGYGLLEPPKNKHWIWTQEKIDEGIQKGVLVFSKNGVPRLKRYLDEMKGEYIGDIWMDISEIQATNKERIGYPTQKPEMLLERIIKCASKENDVILDPFVGGGTTTVVADRLKRQWIGIDQSVSAIKVTELRLYKQQDLFSKPFVVQLHKYDYDTLRYKDAFEFETWIVVQFGGVANTKQRGDLGLDGRTKDGTPIQVKRSDNIGRNVIDNFKSACERYDKTMFYQHKTTGQPVGIIIAFSFGKGAVQEVARLKNEENIIIRLVTVEEIIPIAKKPILTVEFTDLGLDKKQFREIEFVSKGESAAGIEFYAWDWNYNEQEGIFKPEILRDKEGRQRQKFKAGAYCIAVKVVDNDGLESLEVIKLKVNGHIEKISG